MLFIGLKERSSKIFILPKVILLYKLFKFELRIETAAILSYPKNCILFHIDMHCAPRGDQFAEFAAVKLAAKRSYCDSGFFLYLVCNNHFSFSIDSVFNSSKEMVVIFLVL